jgi:hypothetical protein
MIEGNVSREKPKIFEIFEIGLLTRTRWLPGPAATMVHISAFSLGNSRFREIAPTGNTLETPFFEWPASPGHFWPFCPVDESQFVGLACTSKVRDARVCFSPQPHFCERRSRTRSLRTFPSTVFPSSFIFAALITAPICFSESAPVSAIASSIARIISASFGAGGK